MSGGGVACTCACMQRPEVSSAAFPCSPHFFLKQDFSWLATESPAFACVCVQELERQVYLHDRFLHGCSGSKTRSLSFRSKNFAHLAISTAYSFVYSLAMVVGLKYLTLNSTTLVFNPKYRLSIIIKYFYY